MMMFYINRSGFKSNTHSILTTNCCSSGIIGNDCHNTPASSQFSNNSPQHISFKSTKENNISQSCNTCSASRTIVTTSSRFPYDEKIKKEDAQNEQTKMQEQQPPHRWCRNHNNSLEINSPLVCCSIGPNKSSCCSRFGRCSTISHHETKCQHQNLYDKGIRPDVINNDRGETVRWVTSNCGDSSNMKETEEAHQQQQRYEGREIYQLQKRVTDRIGDNAINAISRSTNCNSSPSKSLILTTTTSSSNKIISHRSKGYDDRTTARIKENSKRMLSRHGSKSNIIKDEPTSSSSTNTNGSALQKTLGPKTTPTQPQGHHPVEEAERAITGITTKLYQRHYPTATWHHKSKQYTNDTTPTSLSSTFSSSLYNATNPFSSSSSSTWSSSLSVVALVAADVVTAKVSSIYNNIIRNFGLQLCCLLLLRLSMMATGLAVGMDTANANLTDLGSPGMYQKKKKQTKHKIHMSVSLACIYSPPQKSLLLTLLNNIVIIISSKD
ncbi:uncharacterized protein LOC142225197 [Haematobia irritans]|uniref:uncharacterized protein LOC142225197 n=1 Tax=Haematobia irritans TaxID=7368 RepID=UPI003F50A511